MKLGLIGYGAMGRLVESCALNAGHQIVTRFSVEDAGLEIDVWVDRLAAADVIIDFSDGPAVVRNVTAALRAGVPLVEGTTGWHADESEVRRLVEAHQGALLFGANFSIGVNLFYRVVARAAELFGGIETYAPYIEEAHHARKRDAPSGTARRLAQIMEERMAVAIPISSTRAGYIPGTHRVGFDSLADQVVLTHTARSREGFAAGALAAAQWIRGRQGVYEFSEVLEDMLKERGGER